MNRRAQKRLKAAFQAKYGHPPSTDVQRDDVLRDVVEISTDPATAKRVATKKGKAPFQQVIRGSEWRFWKRRGSHEEKGSR